MWIVTCSYIAKMNVETIEIDSDSLSARKDVEVQSKQFETPAKALQVGKLRASETVSPLARGVVEIYRKTNAAALANSRDGWDGLAKRLHLQSESAKDDEFVVPFIEYDDTADLSPENAAEIARLQTNYGDILVVPLMVPLVDAASDGDDRGASQVSSIIENTQVYLEAVEKLEISKPVMGIIPPISGECTEALTELYSEKGLRAYCVDYNRRSPMAKSQIENVSNPLMRILVNYDILEECIIYAINADFSRPTSGTYGTPDTMYSYTIGIDIVGDNHIAPNLPEKVRKQIANSAVKLRLFNADTVSFEEVPPDDLESFLPADAEIPVRRVQKRINEAQNEQYRFEKIINAELISLFLDSKGGSDPNDIYQELKSGPYAEDSDLKRVQELADEVGRR